MVRVGQSRNLGLPTSLCAPRSDHGDLVRASSMVAIGNHDAYGILKEVERNGFRVESVTTHRDL